MSLLTSSSPQKKDYATFGNTQEERDALLPKPPRETYLNASWFSRLTFSFAHALLETGNQRQLEQEDLWELDGDYSASLAYQTFKRAYLQSNKSLGRACVVAYGRKFLVFGLGSAVMASCSIFAPIVLGHVIDAFSNPVVDTESLTLWVGAFFVSRLVNAFTSAQVLFHTNMTMLQLTVSLKALVFEKAMRRSIQNKNDNEMVEVSNLYTADVDKLMHAGYMFDSAWIMPIQVSVVMYLLYGVLDVAAFAGLTVIFAFMFFNYLVAKGYNNAYDAIMEHKDNRMKAVKEVFGAIHVVKLNAWESKFLERIRKWRLLEMTAISKYLYLMAASFFLFWGAPLFVSVTSFATYALVLGKELTAANVFTAMVLFNSIRKPLSEVPEALQSILLARTGILRMSKFLSAEEVEPASIARDGHNYHKRVEISIEDVTLKWHSKPLVGGEENDEDAESKTTPAAGGEFTSSPCKLKIVLDSVSLQIRKGDFVVIHGAVGSGKSSLLAAMLGELPSEQGKVFVRSHDIAYYSQQPWIQNMTIRDNILFGLPFDQRKYEQVLDACGLVKDVAVFPAGDRTEIGQKGVNLSGGQKARVSLAPACYSDAEVFLLDSPLAAVDAIVQAEIFNKCLCGLLEKKTVVLVTHLHDIIESPAANVNVLLENGKATVTRGPRDKSRREYANLHAKEERPKQDKDKIDDGGDESKASPPVSGTLIEEEEREGGRVSKEVFFAYFHAVGGWPVAVLYLCILATWQCFQVGSDIWLSHWTGSKPMNGASAAHAAESAATYADKKAQVVYNLTVYAFLGLGTGILVFIRALVEAKVGVSAGRFLFNEMTKSLLRAPLRFFDANPIGRVLNRYAEDISEIDFELPYRFFGMLVSTAINLFQLMTAIYVIRWAGVFIIPLGWIYVSIGTYYLAASREVARLNKISTSPILSHLAQSEEGVTVLRAYGQASVDRAIAENFRLNDANNRVWYSQTVLNQWFNLRVSMVGFGVIVLVVSTLIALHKFLSPGIVGLAFMYAVNIDLELSWWVKSWSWLEAAMVSPERILEYIGMESEGNDSDQAIVRTASGQSWPQSGAITFDNVKFAYKPGGDLVLKGLSFVIKHHEKIGIVGRTGAGKSSLTLALFRINELQGGRILLDGVDISKVQLQTLRSHMSIIPQVPVLFKGPLRGYMDPFDEYSDVEIWTVFEKVGMKDMASGLEGKLQYELSENGENFSVGERQLLCLARALLRKSLFVVMDEATASIDRATEKKLQEMIKREFVDATVITIAHRLSTVLESDRILVLSDGRVVEFDTPKALARRQGGVFRELAKEGGYLHELDQ